MPRSVSRAFLFDLDGTLVDSERENAESIAVVLAERGRPLTAEERIFVVGHGWREIYNHLHANGGVDMSFPELMERSAIAKEKIVESAGIRTIPGAAEFVRAAARLAPIAVVSGSSRREVDFCIRMLGLDDVVPWFIGAEDVSRGKPSPEGYITAAGRLAIEPARCVVFEDSGAGIVSAKAAGMRCVAISAANFAAQSQDAADLVVPDFHALRGPDDERLFAPTRPDTTIG